MEDVHTGIWSSLGGISGTYSVTNTLTKSVSNLVVYTPIPGFVEYLEGCLSKKATKSIVTRPQDVFVIQYTKEGDSLIFSFPSDSWKVIHDLCRVV